MVTSDPVGQLAQKCQLVQENRFVFLTLKFVFYVALKISCRPYSEIKHMASAPDHVLSASHLTFTNKETETQWYEIISVTE